MDENYELKTRIRCLESQLHEAEDVLNKRNKEFELKCKENQELHDKIRNCMTKSDSLKAK